MLQATSGHSCRVHIRGRNSHTIAPHSDTGTNGAGAANRGQEEAIHCEPAAIVAGNNRYICPRIRAAGMNLEISVKSDAACR